jgi:hypothetical protein
MIDHMIQNLISLQDTYGEKDGLYLFIPETLKAGFLLHLYKEYDLEMWKDSILQKERKAIAEQQRTTVIMKKEELKDKVCFMVRTTTMHDTVPTNRSIVDTVTSDGLEGIIRCKEGGLFLVSASFSLFFLFLFSSLCGCFCSPRK